ncbi:MULTISPECIES: pirin family protein [Okeania]|uniref:Pirin family protein n=1 Tax=Okeania hirsuta TaxID=1458930 RepID=A0A3N6NRY1_9CYAN|nr:MULTISPECIES: pirin family protein [Okeania]NES79709.1 pirin family protein [Okeania sp. SIO1H4]NET22758.1 pirin family protein [Okeania sp. SIO1H5]NET80063.1 pirin family protein [Okeania sp. SIO1F9]NET96180.1 pirin family protein [Okeania sp. SIO1H2]RQH12202.1 pirin family protein [Okeania hirsuta]
MISIRKAEARGHANYGWLDTHHTFSFANYFDREYMGFRSLRVINEDRVSPSNGFGTHGHRDMEIITYVLEGALEHQDSTGNGAVLYPGEVQHMSTGTGIMHSEYNYSKSEEVHFLQIWLLPNYRGLKPTYSQGYFDIEKNSGKLNLIVAKDGRNGALKINQDVDLFAGVLKQGDRFSYSFDAERYGWVQVARGEIDLNDLSLKAGDGAALSEINDVYITAKSDAEILLFDLA